ncbi:UNVERIFIED_CONTAM: hypothetical protein LK11_05930 [Mumia flava]
MLLGVAAGCRSSLGVAAPVLTSGASRPRKIAAGVAVVAELAGDKNPAAMSRLMTPSLVGRAAAGLTGAGALARGSGSGWAGSLLPGVAGAAGALAGTYGGARWRGWVAAHGRPDLPAALAEDAVAIGLALAATRLVRR